MVLTVVDETRLETEILIALLAWMKTEYQKSDCSGRGCIEII